MIKLALTVMLSFALVSASFSQSVRVDQQKKFNFFYEQAVKCMQSDIDSAYVSAIKASVLAVSREQNYHVNYALGRISNSKKEWKNSNLFYNKALVFANQSQANDLKSNIADNLIELKQYNRALTYAREAVSYSYKAKDEYIYYTYGVIAKAHGKEGRLDSMVYYFDKAMNLIPVKHDKHGKVTAGFLVAKANALHDFGELPTSLKAS